MRKNIGDNETSLYKRKKLGGMSEAVRLSRMNAVVHVLG
ncbi:hypothetical protein BLGI_1553 [Brevibacillus laterosporus GI-9]|nr:hypothetical protein BLGI_1553 [Brevibacillus laterosporus GI-9]